MASYYFSGKHRYQSGTKCSKPEVWEQGQSEEEYQSDVSAKRHQVQMVKDFPDSTKPADSDHHKTCSSKQEGNEELCFTQDPQQLIVSPDELLKQKESTDGNRKSSTDTERVQNPATPTCKQKKNADATKPREKLVTGEVLQGTALRCKCLFLEVK